MTDDTTDDVPDTTDDTTDAPKWADTWKEDWAGDDEAKTNHIGRYASPTDAFNSGYAANLKIASGDYKKTEVFPDKGTDDEKSTWRTNNGIPESAEKYEFEGYDEGYKGDLESLAQTAFDSNMSPDAAKTAMDWHIDQQQLEMDALTDSDNSANETTEDLLRTEWGDGYRGNMNKIHGLLDTAPEGVKEDILGARLASGVPLGSDPNALKFLINLALIQNPTTTIVPSGGNMIDSINDEILELEGMMGNKTSKYNRGPESEKLQGRYRELIAARDNIQVM